ncbi:Uncharacterised protein [Mycobacteroides abscessus]|nr:Uncharacterised protein [Mycobacteroides abscessus]
MISTRSARVSAALSARVAIAATARRSTTIPLRVTRAAAVVAARARAVRASSWPSRSIRKPRRSARHCSRSSVHDSDSGLRGRVAFCAAANCACDRLFTPSTTVRLDAAHSRNAVLRVDQAVMVFGSMPAISAIPVRASTRPHSTPIRRCSSWRSVA